MINRGNPNGLVGLKNHPKKIATLNQSRISTVQIERRLTAILEGGNGAYMIEMAVSIHDCNNLPTILINQSDKLIRLAARIDNQSITINYGDVAVLFPPAVDKGMYFQAHRTPPK